VRLAQSRALGRKVSDEFTVPLCRGHHHEIHRCGDEAAWWTNVGLDPMVAARALWLETHPLRTILDGLAIKDSVSAVANGADTGNAKTDRLSEFKSEAN
jgi:hypothetical protein